jgi:hypothetical protein
VDFEFSTGFQQEASLSVRREKGIQAIATRQLGTGLGLLGRSHGAASLDNDVTQGGVQAGVRRKPLDCVYDLHSGDDLAEDDVLKVAPRRRLRCDEELRPTVSALLPAAAIAHGGTGL